MVRSNRSGGITAVLLIDLDGFKHVNDSFGHALGDKVLRVIATRLTESVRAEDTVARLGGDEFVVVLENMADEEAIGSLAGKLLLAIARPIDHAGHEIVFSGSIGISVHPRDSTEADVLIRNADSAMYEAKSRGRDRFHFYTEELNERAVRYLSLVGNLRKALAENQFWLSYQPIIDGASGKLRGAEALIRWTNADNEMMMPDDFIPAAEESGLIVPIGDWTLRAACLQIQAWQQAGLPVVPVAVNLSARQFFQKDLAQVIARALAAAGNLDPALLHVEVTESVAMQDAKRTSLQLQEIRELGVDISIDDFGTGYSSLAYLRNFPVRDIKIDRSFVSGLPGDRNNGAIVSAVTSLAHALGLRVVAEGVEQLQQLDFLRDLGCDKVQGYHFSKPMRATAFAEWLGGSTQKAP
jgi:diguanylate cyclase (GGDEF)-like protein